jgi:hypothetical protein
VREVEVELLFGRRRKMFPQPFKREEQEIADDESEVVRGLRKSQRSPR